MVSTVDPTLPSPLQAAHDRLQQAAPRVLARLRAMGDLPRFGTVGGQSVASLFWEELGLPITGPVNDIDVFVNRSLPRTMRGLEPLPPDFNPGLRVERTISTSNHRTQVSSVYTNYEQIKFLAMRYTTKILRTYAVGLVNYTLIDNMRTPLGVPGHADDVSLELVEGFDLNLVSVGINLETENVAASRDFLEFLSTHQIKVQTCNTPTHTMMRLASKCSSGQIQGATCDMATEMDLLATAIACQAEQKECGLDVIDMFGPKYRKVHGKFEHLLPPLEHLPQMDDSSKIPGSDDPPESVHLYRLLVPEPSTPENQWLLGTAKSIRQFAGNNLLYLSHFTKLYDIAHPHRSGLDPARVAARRQAVEQLMAMDPKTRTAERAEGFDHACKALDLKVFQAPIKYYDDQDAFSFFFGQQAGKSQAQADRAAKAFNRLEFGHQCLLFNLDEGADTAIQFEVAPQRAWRDMVSAHGAELFNKWASIKSTMEVITAPQQINIMHGIMDAIDAMGETGRDKLALMLVGPKPSGGTQIYDSFFQFLDRQAGPDKGMKFMRWMSEKLVPAWPDITGVDPVLASHLVRAWSAIEYPLPAQAVSVAKGEVAVEMFKRAATCEKLRRSDINHQGVGMGPASPLFIDDGKDLIGSLMSVITLQDIVKDHKSLAVFALNHDLFGPLMEHALANPASRMDAPGLQAMRDYLQETAALDEEQAVKLSFHTREINQEAATRALAFLDNLIMNATVQGPGANTAPAHRGMRF